MNKVIFGLVASLLGLSIASSNAEAFQQPGSGGPTGPYTRPQVSPYINLLRRGSLTENYYGLTRPQVQFQNEAKRLQQEINQTQQDAAQDYARKDLPATGHATSFLNTRGYFLGRGGLGAQRGGVNTTPAGAGKQTTRSGRGG